jgi:hypothetical protein
MNDMNTFERRFEDRVREFAKSGVQPVDSAAVARAVATSHPKSVGAGSRATFAAAAVLALLALGAALLVVGGGPSPTPSEEPSPSLPAIVAPSSTPRLPSAAPTASPVTDPAGVWIATGTMGNPRFYHAAVRLLDGRVLVVGTDSPSDDRSVTTSAELYDPGSGTWSPTGDISNPLALASGATLLHDGKVLVLVAGDAEDEVGAEVYDPASGTWTATGPTVSGANYVGDTAVVLQDGRVLMAGRSGAQIYDPGSGTWSATGKMTIPRHYTKATLLPDGRVIFVGGDVVPDRRVAAAELFDPNTGSWTEIASMHSTQALMASWLQPDGTVLVIGNELVEVYDPATGIWTALAGPTVGYQTATLLSDGTVLVTGGVEPDESCTAALYDPRTGSSTTASSMLRCGYGSSLTLLLDGTVLKAGGGDCNVCVWETGSAELYVPAGVSPPDLGPFPSPRPQVIPSPTPVPTPFPPAAGPVPPNARTWTVTVDNQSSEPATLFVAEENEDGMSRLVGSATPSVVPAGATVRVTFLFPAEGGQDAGWIFVNPRPDEGGSLVSAADIGIPGKILISAEGQVGWVSPPGY